MGDSLFIVDDHNLNSIIYDTQDLWFPTANVDAALQGTLTEGVTGAKASLTFSGTALAVFGLATTANSSAPTIQFSVDGKVLQTTTAPNNGSVNFEFPFFDIEDLSSAQHLLEFTVLNATTDYPFALDFIAYQPVSGAAPTASQQVVTSFLPAPTGALATAAASSSSSSTPVGAIVGGVVGGVAVLVATAIAVYLLCFRHKRKGEPYLYAARGQASDLLDQESKPTPYEVPQATPASLGPQSRYSAGPTSAYSAPSAYTSPGLGYNSPGSAPYTPSEAPVSDYTSVSGPSHPPSLFVVTNAQAPRDSPNQAMSKAAEAGLLSVPQPATFHADSGIRFNSAGEPSSSTAAGTSHVLAAPELADVPPTYSEA
ncbi:uncharacterized protein TRAVEDRAFT_44502 [Trametes versicolor FP-101664 SS1]|uniref:uncharacterized protein n=1 Tax=Trametes versicolor (strain FP-101664) TaxID=717944 RepID=UPI0004624652|nr:uncharacterized protein TRAVEDRAFT_44502 [Trametes versicolor FP-101664 SS1]EIW61676.1 hypothetical protein TRAVEDRAFT_44502 [Trametes versicolor FP-101664 SS1]